MVFDQNTTGTYAGAVSGTGTLTQSGRCRTRALG
jgi:hypothetical protein